MEKGTHKTKPDIKQPKEHVKEAAKETYSDKSHKIEKENKTHSFHSDSHGNDSSAGITMHSNNKANKAEKNSSSSTGIILFFGVFILIVAIYNLAQTSSFGLMIDKSITMAKESAIPPMIGIVTITPKDCADCYDINEVVDAIKSSGANITANKELDMSSEEAINAIAKYGVKKIPAVIVVGEINKSKQLNSKLSKLGEVAGDSYIITAQEPPYIDTVTCDIKGKVTFIYLKTLQCEKCLGLSQVYDQLLELNIKFKSRVELDADSREGRRLIGAYSIKKVPTIIMDKELSEYPEITDSWPQLGTIESDGAYVVRTINAPYYSLEKNRVMGSISLAVLKDESCEECYNAKEFHTPILQRMGITINNSEDIDVSSNDGKMMVKDYNITKIPTIILKGDVAEYPTSPSMELSW